MRIAPKLQNLALGFLLLIAPAAASAGIAVSITIAPPVLPVYTQPPCPVDGYLWSPGYWAYGDAGYYWVPGVWIAPPRVGFLWTPGYWGFGGGVYLWHAGYWGPHVGFYGGVNYGFGYFGVGFGGGVWAGNVFRYNSAVLNVNASVVHNVYVDRTVIRNVNVNRVSFNGPGGLQARPSPEEQRAMHEQHVGATPNQLSHQQAASRDRANFASVNHGRPGPAAPAGRGFGAAAHEAPKMEASRAPHPAEHAQARPAEHAQARPAEHAQARPAEHAQARPAEHAPARPAEHAQHEGGGERHGEKR
jgi:hypothetical protein